MKKLFMFLMVFSFWGPTFASETPAQELRRLSYLLRGTPPSIDEYENLTKVSSSQVESYLKTMQKNFIATKEFDEKMLFRLDTLFRFRIGQGNGVFNRFIRSEAENFLPNSVFDNFVSQILSKNESWDTLLLRQEYNVKAQLGRDYDNINFYEFLFGDDTLKLKSMGEFESTLFKAIEKNQKDSLAGVISTPSFFGRYNTTKINKNRRRAAAIFRVFLCDDMKPAIPGSKKEDDDLLLKTLGIGQDAGGHGVTTPSTDAARHGSDPACMSCHYKLDPAGKVFAGSTAQLAPQSSPGGLVYKRTDGSMVNIPVDGLGGLGQAITGQKEYAQCQVQHFWDWFVGEDIALSTQRKDELVKVFDKVGRKPKDFIYQLLQTKEFKNGLDEQVSTATIKYSNVQPILKKCDSCHGQMNNLPSWSVGYPFDKDAKKNLSFLSRIVEAVDLKEKNANDLMPPSYAGWKLSADERNLLKMWVIGGAKTDDKMSTVPADVLKQYVSTIKVAQIKAYVPVPTFYSTHKRYFEYFDLSATLEGFLGRRDSDYECFRLSAGNAVALGFKSQVDGAATSRYISNAFLDFVSTCGSRTLSQMSITGEGEQFKAFINRINKEFPFNLDSSKLLTMKFSAFSEPQMKIIVKSAIELIVGPGVLAKNKINNLVASNIKGLKKLKYEDQDMRKVLTWIFTKTLISQEALSY